MKGNSTFAERAFGFYQRLTPPGHLPGTVEVMNPYRDPDVRQYVKRFLQRYYSDNRRRIAVFGINPGGVRSRHHRHHLHGRIGTLLGF